MPLRKIEDPAKLCSLLDAVLLIEQDLSLRVVLDTLIRESCELAGATYGALGVLDDSRRTLAEFITYGIETEDIIQVGALPTGKGVLGLLIADAKPIRISNISHNGASLGFPANHPVMSSFLGVPIAVGDRVFGNIYLTNKIGATEFDEQDETLISYLAKAAGIAIENAQLHNAVANYALRADRERIARELHDEIIQRLFAIGLSLQATMRLINGNDANTRVQTAIDDLDEAIKMIRATIFALETTRSTNRESFRAQVLALIRELHAALGFEPSVTFSGPLDTMVTKQVASQALPMVREALSNIARHARATATTITLACNDSLNIVIEDNGRGISNAGTPSSKGLKNMAGRAEALGGHFTLEKSKKLGGARVSWSVPL